MAKNYYDITLALAGICQSARLVQQLAHQGHCDADALHVSLNSVIDLNPGSTLGVFGGSETNLRLGLETLLGVLNASSRQGLNAELTRYTLSLMVLERKLSAAKGALDTLGDRIAGCSASSTILICSPKRCSVPWPAFMLTSSARWAHVFRSPALLPCCKARRFRQKYAPPCWQVFVPPCCGIRLAVAACS